MQNREFEKSVQQKMEELKLPPSAALWDKVEAALPAQKKPRRWLLFFWLFTALITGSLLLQQYYFNSSPARVENKTVKNTAPVATASGTNKTAVPKTNETNISALSAADTGGSALSAQPETTVQPAAKKYNRTAAVAVLVNNEVFSKAANKKAGTKSFTKIKVKAPGTAWDATESTNETFTETTTETLTNNMAAIPANDSTIQLAVEKPSSETVAVIQQDSSLVTAAKPVNKKQPAKKIWQFGIYAAAGRAAVKDGFFTNQPAYYNMAYAGALNQGPPLSGISNNSSAPAIPTAGAAFAIGLAAERKAGERWRFLTGLNYLYQSTALRVGGRVDSSVTIRYDANKSIAAGSYYRTGTSESYKNNFHLLELPVSVQYTFSQKIPVYAEAGITASYLLHSNALVYNAGNATYFTDAAVFNRLLLIPNAGAGVRVLQKTNYPVSFGFQLRQGMVSVIKPSFGRQHFVNSLLYARVLLKK